MGIIPAIIAAVSGLTSIGSTIAGDVSKPSMPTPVTPAPTGPSAQDLAQQRELLAQRLPNAVSQTSGLASPQQDLWLTLLQTGLGGQPGAQASGQAALGQQFTPVNNAPTNATVANQPVALADFLNNYSGAQ